MKCANRRDHRSKPHFKKITEYTENKFKKGEAEGSTTRRLWLLSRHELGSGGVGGSENRKDGHV